MIPSKTAKIHVCGVTCHRGDANCNGYCIDAKVPHAKLIEPASVIDAAIEAEIIAKGLTAPRVTPADIEANIAREHYFTAAEGVYGAGQLQEPPIHRHCPQSFLRLTFCVLLLRNGFTVTGESACASPENFDAEVGQKVARANAVQKIWPLMGYLLRESLSLPAKAAPEAGAAAQVCGNCLGTGVERGVYEHRPCGFCSDSVAALSAPDQKR